MKQIFTLLVLGCFGMALARFIAVPIEETIDMNELTRLRLPREVEAIGVVRGPRGVSANQSAKKQEYVDFGAHTGSRGSYGWYADFPVHSLE